MIALKKMEQKMKDCEYLFFLECAQYCKYPTLAHKCPYRGEECRILVELSYANVINTITVCNLNAIDFSGLEDLIENA